MLRLATAAHALRAMAAAVCLLCLAAHSLAAEVRVAVAANFAEPMKAIAAALQQSTGHSATITVGATGKLYAQIRNGAPFDVFLSADSATAGKLEAQGLAVPGSRFTYATGRLVLWSARNGRVDDQGAVLRATDLGKLAYAAPKVSPYGAAAVETMQRLGLEAALVPKLVQGESIGQAFHFVQTGNADVGFVALSQVMHQGRLRSGSMWLVPEHLHSPIHQEAVLLQRGANSEAARALLQLLRAPQTRALIRSYGYSG